MKANGKLIDDDIVELAEGIASEAAEEILAFGLPNNRIALNVAVALQAERDKYAPARANFKEPKS